MSIKIFAAASVFALSAFAGQAQAAAPTWTITTTGKIDGGYDNLGIFGAVGKSLAGLTFKQSVTASINRADWQNQNTNPYYHDDEMLGVGPTFTDTVTINGKSVTFTALSTISGIQQIANDFSSADAHGYGDRIVSFQNGTTAGGANLYSYSSAYSASTPFVPTTNFGQTIEQTNISGPLFSKYSSFTISGNENTNFYSYNVDTISVNAVPEPETYAMLLAGLGLVGYTARRNRKAA